MNEKLQALVGWAQGSTSVPNWSFLATGVVFLGLLLSHC